MSYQSLRELKQLVKKLIENIDGVGGIGLAWDELGEPILRIDIDDNSTRSLVEKRLSILDLKINSKNEIDISDREPNFVNNKYNVQGKTIRIDTNQGQISQTFSGSINNVKIREARQINAD
ncbi:MULTISPECIES: hypothetical protein [Okeania]|uniref:Uncharacterized protein n=1 Tax=Okeania hirsuta TaxID=1458930 RepID=A0A3N6RMW5_9CYAN|nr:MULTISPECIES: hypothetical protein [Okeania]NET76648.1 hypothetical protein [Okeania sp. SIO1F9]RQH24014.1 hypothetical protein D4Z78_05270 [Okeania hirsuta]RQH39637.1 hypothetical protein D5R40_16715 [Okeania hirsuta]